MTHIDIGDQSHIHPLCGDAVPGDDFIFADSADPVSMLQARGRTDCRDCQAAICEHGAQAEVCDICGSRWLPEF